MMPTSTNSDQTKLSPFIDAVEASSRSRWAARLGVSEDALRRAVRTVGSRTSTVMAHLGVKVQR